MKMLVNIYSAQSEEGGDNDIQTDPRTYPQVRGFCVYDRIVAPFKIPIWNLESSIDKVITLYILKTY